MNAADIGVVGLAVMGQNLVLNMIDHGYTVAVYNRTVDKVRQFAYTTDSQQLIGCESLQDFVNALALPRKVMLMVKAGKPVDDFIEKIVPLLEPNDIIIDGGNSNYKDTIRRTNELAAQQIKFVGAGISGGEEGARYGPSIMPGGNPNAWPKVQQIFQDIAAKVEDGTACCQWVGIDGAGHYVKMVHNGIEYGDMELIIEAYHFMRELLEMPPAEIGDVFAQWNTGKLDSYLIEITAKILKVTDEDGTPLIDKILDKAGQKGTGMWTVISALELGLPATLIGEAVFQRNLSAQKEERVAASQHYKQEIIQLSPDKRLQYITQLENALYASKIISYSQGFMLIKAAATEYNWNLNFGDIALMWRGGCIIRSIFLGKIKEAFDVQPDLPNLLIDPYFKQQITDSLTDWRQICSAALLHGLPMPSMVSALAYFDGYRRATLPANLLQAQRDYFGAHTYQRVDKQGWYHTDWINIEH